MNFLYKKSRGNGRTELEVALLLHNISKSYLMSCFLSSSLFSSLYSKCMTGNEEIYVFSLQWHHLQTELRGFC